MHTPPPIAPPLQALIDRLEQTSRGDDAAAFEVAVCDAFAHLGFLATHIGGQEHPDGYADALLGPLGYRVMLECKMANADVHNPDAVEAGKYRARYDAQYCALIGPSFSEAVELASELHTHDVSAWTVEDLRRLLDVGSNPHEMLALFKAGFAADSLDELLWERVHGQAKQLTIVCEYLQKAGWSAQTAAAKAGGPQTLPH